MIIYNVTCNLAENMAAEWLQWMKSEHIPEVMATGKFTKYKILKVLTNVHGDEDVNYSIQYFANSIEDYEVYRDHFAPLLQAKTKEKYGEKVLAFRTILEVIE